MAGRLRSLDELAGVLASEPPYGRPAPNQAPDALVDREFERLLSKLAPNEQQAFRNTWTGNFNPDGDPLDDPHDRLVALWVALGLTTRDRQYVKVSVNWVDLCTVDPTRRRVDWLPDVRVTEGDLRRFLNRFDCPWPAFLERTAGARQATLLPYSQAFTRLRKRLPGLTDGELAMWVSNNWLKAFDRHGEEFNVFEARNRDQLREYGFSRDALKHFHPGHRYLTFEQLRRRWQLLIKDPARYIREKVVPLGEPAEGHAPDDSRVFFFHAFDPLHRRDIPLEDCLFSLPQVIEREKAEFPDIALAYERAKTRLAARLEATEHELALWVWMGHLSAYLDEDLSEPFHFRSESSVTDYLSGEARQGTGLNGAYFNRADIEAFQPVDRWSTFEQVAARWRDHGDAEAIKGKLRAAEHDDRLIPCNPLADEAIEQALFTVAEIEALERFYGWESKPPDLPPVLSVRLIPWITSDLLSAERLARLCNDLEPRLPGGSEMVALKTFTLRDQHRETVPPYVWGNVERMLKRQPPDDDVALTEVLPPDVYVATDDLANVLARLFALDDKPRTDPDAPFRRLTAEDWKQRLTHPYKVDISSMKQIGLTGFVVEDAPDSLRRYVQRLGINDAPEPEPAPDEPDTLTPFAPAPIDKSTIHELAALGGAATSKRWEPAREFCIKTAADWWQKQPDYRIGEVCEHLNAWCELTVR